jgi:folate-binding protein YgfZ
MYCHLKNRALLKISGSDSEAFLQAQLSNDINKLDDISIQLNAYCQHQGKILALFWVMRFDGDFFLSFPIDLLESIKSRFQMFVIMSDVIITDVTSKYSQIGLINMAHADAYKINDKQALIITNSLTNFESNFESNDIWTMTSIDTFLPEIFSITTEKLLPQMLNLDINEFGVNFSKGCYPGQEVVARLHYLGKAKRRLYSFSSEFEMNIGDSLLSVDSKSLNASGVVINAVKYNSQYYCLATLKVEHKDQMVTINNNQGSILKRINNE